MPRSSFLITITIPSHGEIDLRDKDKQPEAVRGRAKPLDGWGLRPETDTPVHSCVHQILREQANRRPEAVAVLAPGRRPLTYGGLWAQVKYVVNQLNALGFGRRERVALVLPNGPEAAVAFLAVASAATVAPLNPAYQTGELEQYLAALRAKAVIVPAGSEGVAAMVAQRCGIPAIELFHRPEAAGLFALTTDRRKGAVQGGLAEAGDVALMLPTSGTTAQPKLVPLTHANICAAASQTRHALELREADRCLNVMPLFHSHGLVAVLLSSMMAGASVVCTGGFDVTGFLKLMGECQPTWYSAVPTFHQAILAGAVRHASLVACRQLRFVRSASAPLSSRLREEIESLFGAPVTEGYGLTEAPSLTNTPLPPRPRRNGSLGLAVGAQVGIMDAAGALLPAGSVGEIVAQGPQVMGGYDGDLEANRVAFTNGWFRTGDEGYIDADGFLFMTGRLKEIINRGGEKIAPQEVDEALLDHPAVALAATFGVPHSTLGEDVAAAVILRDGAQTTEQNIRSFVAKRLAPFKVPGRVVIVDEIPASATGKLRRLGLAERLDLTDGGRSRSQAAAPRNALEARLVEIWCDVLKRNRVGIHEGFLSLGGDSIQASRLLSKIGDALGIEVPFVALFEAQTIARLAEVIMGILGEDSGTTPSSAQDA